MYYNTVLNFGDSYSYGVPEYKTFRITCFVLLLYVTQQNKLLAKLRTVLYSNIASAIGCRTIKQALFKTP